MSVASDVVVPVEKAARKIPWWGWALAALAVLWWWRRRARRRAAAVAAAGAGTVAGNTGIMPPPPPQLGAASPPLATPSPPAIAEASGGVSDTGALLGPGAVRNIFVPLNKLDMQSTPPIYSPPPPPGAIY